MASFLTCSAEALEQSAICPVGQGLKIVEGYLLTVDPTFVDTSKAMEFYSAGFGAVLVCYILARSAGSVIRLFYHVDTKE